MKKLLTLISIMSFMVLGQVAPAFASYDGALRCVTSTSLNMRSGPSTSYGIIMTMANHEAYANTGDSGTGWDYCLGWKSSTGSVVGGYVATGYAITPAVTAKYALSIYHSESDSSYYNQDVPANAQINVGTSAQATYSNLYYLRFYNYNLNGTYKTVGQFDSDGVSFIHTAFRSSSPSYYYLNLITS